MENEEVKQPEESLAEEQALLKAYKNLEANSVSKEKYEKDIKELKEKNELYLKAITEGQSVDAPSEKEYDIKSGISNISKFKGTNLEYWKQMTELTDNVLRALPESEIVKIAGPEGLEEIVKVNEGMKQIVKDSNGDPDTFRSLYKQRVQESSPRIGAEIEKAGGLYNYLSKTTK